MTEAGPSSTEAGPTSGCSTTPRNDSGALQCSCMHPDGPWADLRKALFGCLVVNNADNKRWFEDFFAKLRQQPADNATACPFPAKPNSA